MGGREEAREPGPVGCGDGSVVRPERLPGAEGFFGWMCGDGSRSLGGAVAGRGAAEARDEESCCVLGRRKGLGGVLVRLEGRERTGGRLSGASVPCGAGP